MANRARQRRQPNNNPGSNPSPSGTGKPVTLSDVARSASNLRKDIEKQEEKEKTEEKQRNGSAKVAPIPNPSSILATPPTSMTSLPRVVVENEENNIDADKEVQLSVTNLKKRENSFTSRALANAANRSREFCEDQKFFSR